MPEHMLFHFVFLLQVLLVSFYLPRKILGRMRYVFETYPPSTHPKLYPRPVEHYEKARRNYRIMNRVILIAGFLLVTALLGISRSGDWDHVIAMWLFFVQCLPVMRLDFSSIREARLMRESCSTRKAELRPRRLFEFVSPAVLGLVIATYVAFSLLVLYVRQLEFSWFGGYWNIAGMTVMNLVFAAVAFRQIYGKKLNPHQAPEDRITQIETVVNTLAFVSVAATVFIALNVALAAFDLRAYQPVAHSLYFQLLAVVCFRVYRVYSSNFEVYKEDPLAT